MIWHQLHGLRRNTIMHCSRNAGTWPSRLPSSSSSVQWSKRREELTLPVKELVVCGRPSSVHWVRAVGSLERQPEHIAVRVAMQSRVACCLPAYVRTSATEVGRSCLFAFFPHLAQHVTPAKRAVSWLIFRRELIITCISRGERNTSHKLLVVHRFEGKKIIYQPCSVLAI